MTATMPEWVQEAARTYAHRVAIDAETIPGKRTDTPAVDVVALQWAFEAGAAAAIKAIADALLGKQDDFPRCVIRGESSGPDN